MTEDTNANDDQGFLRQRRNLIVGCLIVLFLETTVSPPDNLSILGVTLKITYADYIVYWLWVFTCYWLLRYFQYLPTLQTLKDQYGYEHRQSLKKLIKKLADIEINKVYSDESRKTHEFFVDEKNIYIEGRIRLSMIAYNWTYDSQRDIESDQLMGSMTSDRKQKDFVLPKLHSLHLNFCAFVLTCIRTPLATEYVVPVLLFIAAAFSSMHRIL